MSHMSRYSANIITIYTVLYYTNHEIDPLCRHNYLLFVISLTSFFHHNSKRVIFLYSLSGACSLVARCPGAEAAKRVCYKLFFRHLETINDGV